jgi:hypothetical protein
VQKKNKRDFIGKYKERDLTNDFGQGAVIVLTISVILIPILMFMSLVYFHKLHISTQCEQDIQSFISK